LPILFGVTRVANGEGFTGKADDNPVGRNYL